MTNILPQNAAMDNTEKIKSTPNGTGPQRPRVDLEEFERMDADSVPKRELKPKIFKRLTLADMLEMPPKQWLIDQVIGPGDLGMIFGAPGSGKTFVVLDMVFSACLGRQFAGRFDTAHPLTIAYAAGEGGSGLAQRFQAATEYYGIEADALTNLHIFTNVPQLYDSKDPCNAAQFVTEYREALDAGEVKPLDILILDTLHSVSAGADENSAQHMGEVLREARRIAEALQCAVILVHHSNKAGTGERGSSALRGAMDAMIEVREVGNGRMISCEKLKDGEAWKPQTFDLIAKAESVRVEWGDVGESSRADSTPARLLDVLRGNPGVRFTAKSLAEVVDAGSGTKITTALNRLTERGDIRRELLDAGKPSSNRNPWVYWIDLA